MLETKVRRRKWFISLVFYLLTSTAVLHAAENLRLNPKLNYSSDSRDGPLVTGDRMEEGAIQGKPNYIIIYGEG